MWSGLRTIFLVDAAIVTLKDQQELTRLKGPAVITVHSREYGKKSEEELTFVFNLTVNAVNNKSKNYYAVSSLPQTWRAA